MTRQELVMKTGLSDRMIRRSISQLRKQGVAIISTSDSSGYFIADTEEELNHFLAENTKRAKDLLYMCKQVKEGYAKEHQEYPLLEECIYD